MKISILAIYDKVIFVPTLSYLGFFPVVYKWIIDLFAAAVNKDHLKLDLKQGHPMIFSS